MYTSRSRSRSLTVAVGLLIALAACGSPTVTAAPTSSEPVPVETSAAPIPPAPVATPTAQPAAFSEMDSWVCENFVADLGAPVQALIQLQHTGHVSVTDPGGAELHSVGSTAGMMSVTVVDPQLQQWMDSIATAGEAFSAQWDANAIDGGTLFTLVSSFDQVAKVCEAHGYTYPWHT